MLRELLILLFRLNTRGHWLSNEVNHYNVGISLLLSYIKTSVPMSCLAILKSSKENIHFSPQFSSEKKKKLNLYQKNLLKRSNTEKMENI